MKIIVSISGFKGPNTSLACLYDEETGVLVVAKQINYREDKPDDTFSMVSNLDLPSVDFKFKEEHMSNAIRSYFTAIAQGTLDVDKALARYQPDNRIEEDRIDESGRKYRVSPDIDNGQMAVLAVVAYIDRLRGVTAALEGARDIMSEMRILTI